MKDDTKYFEISLTLIGLIVTAFLGYGQYQLGLGQQRISEQQTTIAKMEHEAETKRAVDEIEIQTMNLVAGHLVNLAKPGAEFESSQKVVLAASEYLTSRHNRTSLADMAARISEGNVKVPLDTKTRLQEASAVAAEKAGWFAVLMSLPVSDEVSAKRAANRMQSELNARQAPYGVQMYRTKISNNFALVLGGKSEEKAAREAATFARRSGLALDAFAQQDREWTYVGSAPFAGI